MLGEERHRILVLDRANQIIGRIVFGVLVVTASCQRAKRNQYTEACEVDDGLHGIPFPVGEPTCVFFYKQEVLAGCFECNKLRSGLRDSLVRRMALVDISKRLIL